MMKTTARQPALISRRSFLAGLSASLAGCALQQTQSESDQPSEAKHYEKLAGKKVRCLLCPKQCVVADGARGWCGVRENRGGRYYSLVYGRAAAIHLDPIEKKPFFHVYPGSQAFSIATVGCNLECKFCQNWELSQTAPEDLPVPYSSPDIIAEAAAQSGARTIAYTYNEPTVFHEYMVDCAKAGLQRSIESVVVTSGFISAHAQRELFPVVKAIKIDLKAFSQQFYGDICSASLQPVLDSLKRLADSGVWHEVVVLLIPTLNDGDDELQRMTEWIVKNLGTGVPVHFSRYHPTYKMKNIPPTPPATLRRARDIAMEQGCNFVYIGNMPVKDEQNTVCPSCGKTVIERYGYRIVKNSIEEGACAFCKKPIPGVWA